MDKTQIELSVDSYKNLHLMLHNLIELTTELSNGADHTPEQYKSMFNEMIAPLKTVKNTLEVK